DVRRYRAVLCLPSSARQQSRGLLHPTPCESAFRARRDSRLSLSLVLPYRLTRHGESERLDRQESDVPGNGSLLGFRQTRVGSHLRPAWPPSSVPAVQSVLRSSSSTCSLANRWN